MLRFEPSKDYFKRSNRDERIHDHYDTVSSASARQSTGEFDTVRFDGPTSRWFTLPRGIRHLMLFPISSRQYTDNFHLTVLEEGKKLVIRIIVYGTVYQITTDDVFYYSLAVYFTSPSAVTVLSQPTIKSGNGT